MDRYGKLIFFEGEGLGIVIGINGLDHKLTDIRIPLKDYLIPPLEIGNCSTSLDRGPEVVSRGCETVGHVKARIGFVKLHCDRGVIIVLYRETDGKEYIRLASGIAYAAVIAVEEQLIADRKVCKSCSIVAVTRGIRI